MQLLTDIVESDIVESDPRPGDRPPGDEALIALYGVSRTIVRHAVSKLLTAGVIIARRPAALSSRRLGRRDRLPGSAADATTCPWPGARSRKAAPILAVRPKLRRASRLPGLVHLRLDLGVFECRNPVDNDPSPGRSGASVFSLT